MARTHRKYSSVRNRGNDRHDKINDAINAECEFEEQAQVTRFLVRKGGIVNIPLILIPMSGEIQREV